ncbi:MAG: PDZ domain-containing protein [Phycisphaerales bacterium]|nr:PDZ domain-containing protein [Phycisphaerales bacterium]
MKRILAFILLGAVTPAALCSPEHVQELLREREGLGWSARWRLDLRLAGDDAEVTLHDLELVAGSMALTPELRELLDVASLTRFRRDTPKGALGVSFGATRPGHVEIQTIVGDGGFPASDMLKPGDVIVEVAGQPIEGSEHLRAEILSRLPGDELPVIIEREGLTIARSLPLGSYRDLTGAAMIETDVLRRALEIRRARLGIEFPQPDTIGAAIDAASWIDAAFPDGPASRTGPMNDSLNNGVLSSGKSRSVFAGYPLYPRRGEVWSSEGIAQQAVLDAQRTAISAEISEGFAKRARLVARIESVRKIGEENGTLEELDPEIRALSKELVKAEWAIQKLTQKLDELDAPEPDAPEKTD